MVKNDYALQVVVSYNVMTRPLYSQDDESFDGSTGYSAKSLVESLDALINVESTSTGLDGAHSHDIYIDNTLDVVLHDRMDRMDRPGSEDLFQWFSQWNVLHVMLKCLCTILCMFCVVSAVVIFCCVYECRRRRSQKRKYYQKMELKRVICV